MVRIRLATLRTWAGAWDTLGPWLADDLQVVVLLELESLAGTAERPKSPPTASPRRLRRALRELCESLERFNQRWVAFLHSVDLGPINELRAGYNRYYILEKECAVRSPVLARQGFCRLEPLTTAELAALVPPLPVPALKLD
jgi:hypothetical protein